MYITKNKPINLGFSKSRHDIRMNSCMGNWRIPLRIRDKWFWIGQYMSRPGDRECKLYHSATQLVQYVINQQLPPTSKLAAISALRGMQRQGLLLRHSTSANRPSYAYTQHVQIPHGSRTLHEYNGQSDVQRFSACTCSGGISYKKLKNFCFIFCKFLCYYVCTK